MSTQMRAQVDKLLTGVLMSFRPVGFIADQVFAQVQHTQYSGKLGKLTNAHLRIQNTLMGGKGSARRLDIIVRATDSFEIESHGLEGMVTPRDEKNVEDPFDAQKEEAEALGLALQIGKEKSLADALTSVSVVTQNQTLSGAAQFNDYVNSDPLAKFETAIAAIEDAVGVEPDTAIMNSKVRRILRRHPAIIEFIRGKVQPGAKLNDSELAEALGVERILVGGAKYNSAKEGQSDTLVNIWGNHIVFGVLPEKAQVGQVSAGYQVRLKGSSPRQVRKWSVNNPPESTAILCTDEYDLLLTSQAPGGLYLIKDAVAA
jgi:hypothetical protein